MLSKEEPAAEGEASGEGGNAKRAEPPSSARAAGWESGSDCVTPLRGAGILSFSQATSRLGFWPAANRRRIPA